MFKEQESWNGTIDTLTDAHTPLMEEEDVKEEEKQEPREQTPNRVTLARTPRFSEPHGSSSRSTDQNYLSTESGNESSNGKKKMRNSRDI